MPPSNRWLSPWAQRVAATAGHSLKKPFWASEESSSYDDINGGACWVGTATAHHFRWHAHSTQHTTRSQTVSCLLKTCCVQARVVTSHYVLAKTSSSIMWNLIGSYYHGSECRVRNGALSFRCALL